jgi:quinol monooxygenase YgiN
MTVPVIQDGEAFVSRFTVAPEQRAQFVGIFTALVEGFRPMMGEMINFAFYGWSRSDEFIAIESWKDPALVAAVRQDPNWGEAVTALLACCSKPMTMDVFGGMNSDRSVFATNPQGPSTVHPKSGDIGVEFL